MKPFEYQEDVLTEIKDKFRDNDRIVLQMFTGAGKTAVFSFLSEYWVNTYRKKVLILCHRSELVDQSAETLTRVGLTYEKVFPNVRKLHHAADVYVAMIETLDRRLKRNPNFLKDVGLVVADECHVQVFQKVFRYFQSAKILGVTATPVLLGRNSYYKCDICGRESDVEEICCNREMMEWTKPKVMSDTYQDIVVGPTIQSLIDFGQLVPEITYSKNYADISGLKTDSSGEYTNSSMDSVFGSEDAVFNVLLNYLEICKGKKTIIFNSSTKTNKLIYDQFKEKGINCRMYDSVNDTGESRKSIVDWFRSDRDAVLLNCGVFTAGLDVREIEAVIVNRATKSLSLWLQIVGRGGRSSDKIFKDHFVLVDGGGNVAELGEWSQERDWVDIFWNGIGKPKPKSADIMDVQDCQGCGALFPKVAQKCPMCGLDVRPEVVKEKNVVISDDVLQPIREIPPPNARKIIEYTLSQGEGFPFALNIMYGRIVDMFIYYRITKENYLTTRENGVLEERVSNMVRPCYFAFINEPSFKGNANRRLRYVINKSLEKVAKYYEV